MEVEIVKKFPFEAVRFLPGDKNEKSIRRAREHEGVSEYKQLWILEVGVKGEIDPSTGNVIDPIDFRSVVNATVLREIHLKFLNEVQADFPYPFPKENPTLENILKWIVDRLDNPFLLKNLSFIRLYESDAAYADYAEWRKPDRINEEWDDFINKEGEKKQAWQCLLQAGRRLLDEIMQDDD